MKILLIGDSITNGFDTDKLLPDMEIINKGVYGDNSVGVLNRLANDVVTEMPDYVYFLIGTNDFAMGRSNNQLLETLKKTAELIKKYLPKSKIIFTSILPTRRIENRPNERINKMNELIKQLCAEYKAEYFTLHSAMKDKSGQMKIEYTNDGLHLTDAAYKTWAEILRQRHS
ncbi:MAG: hypothetical protein K8H86_01755 [Ignavibacteriaceae bacterium]|nr:hypothetical protein [Ignavibacteriaceae bacterium]